MGRRFDNYVSWWFDGPATAGAVVGLLGLGLAGDAFLAEDGLPLTLGVLGLLAVIGGIVFNVWRWRLLAIPPDHEFVGDDEHRRWRMR